MRDRRVIRKPLRIWWGDGIFVSEYAEGGHRYVVKPRMNLRELVNNVTLYNADQALIRGAKETAAFET